MLRKQLKYFEIGREKIKLLRDRILVFCEKRSLFWYFGLIVIVTIP